MQILVNDARGIVLAYMVTVCRSQTHGVHKAYLKEGKFIGQYMDGEFRYSTNIGKGMRVILENNIALVPKAAQEGWNAYKSSAVNQTVGHNEFFSSDHDPLVAGLRTYVKSVMGDSVEVPEKIAAFKDILA